MAANINASEGCMYEPKDVDGFKAMHAFVNLGESAKYHPRRFPWVFHKCARRMSRKIVLLQVAQQRLGLTTSTTKALLTQRDGTGFGFHSIVAGRPTCYSGVGRVCSMLVMLCCAYYYGYCPLPFPLGIAKGPYPRCLM